MAPRRKYAALPKDDPLDDFEDNPVKAPKCILATIVICISILCAGILYLTLGAVSLEPAAVKSDEDYTSAFRDHLTRAGGDEYLLGVGKADITG
jgi:hypothetical protein